MKTRVAKRAALLFGVALVLLGAAELAVRWIAPRALEPAILQPEAGAAYFGAGMLESRAAPGLRYAGRPHATVEIHGVVYRHDALGLRGPDQDRSQEDGRARRVLLVGDSNAYGWGVAEPDALRARLQQLLQRDASARVSVFTAAFPGYNSADQRALMEHLWSTIEPHVVLVLWFVNDLERLGFHVDTHGALFCDPLPAPAAWKPRLWRSHLYRLLSLGRLGALRDAGTLEAASAATRAFGARHIRAMRDYAHARGARFALIDVPLLEPSGTTQRMRRDGYPAASASAWLRELARDAEVPHLELLDAIEGEPTALLWASMQRMDHHPNARAHALFAAAIAQFVRAHGLLADA